MSRGLGKMQRQILAHLEDPLPVSYSGTERETTVCCADCVLRDGVYDLQWVSKRVLRERNNAADVTFLGETLMQTGDRTEAYSAAFSRAVKGLLKRRILYAPPAVPLRVMWSRRAHPRIVNGKFIQALGQRVRFVQYGSAHPKFKRQEPA